MVQISKMSSEWNETGMGLGKNTFFFITLNIFLFRFLQNVDLDLMRSKSKRSLLTLTPEEKRDIKKKKIDGRIKKMGRRQKLLENEADKLKTKMNQLMKRKSIYLNTIAIVI